MGCKCGDLIDPNVFETANLQRVGDVTVDFENLTPFQVSVLLSHTSPSFMKIGDWCAHPTAKPLSHHFPLEKTTQGGLNLLYLSISASLMSGPDLVHLCSLFPRLQSLQIRRTGTVPLGVVLLGERASNPNTPAQPWAKLLARSGHFNFERDALRHRICLRYRCCFRWFVGGV